MLVLLFLSIFLCPSIPFHPKPIAHFMNMLSAHLSLHVSCSYRALTKAVTTSYPCRTIILRTYHITLPFLYPPRTLRSTERTLLHCHSTRHQTEVKNYRLFGRAPAWYSIIYFPPHISYFNWSRKQISIWHNCQDARLLDRQKFPFALIHSRSFRPKTEIAVCEHIYSSFIIKHLEISKPSQPVNDSFSRLGIRVSSLLHTKRLRKTFNAVQYCR